MNRWHDLLDWVGGWPTVRGGDWASDPAARDAEPGDAASVEADRVEHIRGAGQ